MTPSGPDSRFRRPRGEGRQSARPTSPGRQHGSRSRPRIENPAAEAGVVGLLAARVSGGSYPNPILLFRHGSLWGPEAGSTLKMRTEPAPSQSGAKRRGKARRDADRPYLRAGSRQSAVRLPRHRYLLARVATPSLTRSHWQRLVERRRRSRIFGPERARPSAPLHRHPVRERSRADACRHQDTAGFPLGVILATSAQMALMRSRPPRLHWGTG